MLNMYIFESIANGEIIYCNIFISDKDIETLEKIITIAKNQHKYMLIKADGGTHIHITPFTEQFNLYDFDDWKHMHFVSADTLDKVTTMEELIKLAETIL